MVMGVVAAAFAASFGSGCKPGGATCVDGAAKNAETGICIKTTGEYTLEEKAHKVGDVSNIAVRNKMFHGPTIWIEKPDDLDMRSKAIAGMASNDLKLVASGDTAPSKGKFFHFHNTKGNYDFAVTLVSTKSHMYRCEIQNGDPKEAPEQVAMCKTLGGP